MQEIWPTSATNSARLPLVSLIEDGICRYDAIVESEIEVSLGAWRSALSRFEDQYCD